MDFSESLLLLPLVLASESVQLCGDTPLCAVFTCLFMFPFVVNAISQYLHLYGRAPACIDKCLLRELEELNTLLHMLQQYSSSPLQSVLRDELWPCMWFVRSPEVGNTAEQAGHECALSGNSTCGGKSASCYRVHVSLFVLLGL